MKAIALREFGGPETLRFEEIATPEPAADEALIRVHNVSVNVTLDVLLRKGLYARKPVLPHVMGTDPVGEVVALGAEAKGLALGDRVGVHTPLHSDICVPGQESRHPRRHRRQANSPPSRLPMREGGRASPGCHVPGCSRSVCPRRTAWRNRRPC